MAKIVPDYPFFNYVVQAELSAEEEVIAKALVAILKRTGDLNAFAKKYGADAKRLALFVSSLDVLSEGRALPARDKEDLIGSLTSILPIPNSRDISTFVINKMYGYGLLQTLLDDEQVEEITFSGDQPVFAYLREKGVCKTNVVLNRVDVASFFSQLSIPDRSELFETRLADGSRASILLPPLVTTPSVTIRKFRSHPFSLLDLIEKGTITSELAAFLWLAVDGLMFNPLNFMIVGSTSAGKTSLLNACASFIPPAERVIVIEDVPELNLSARSNSVQATASPALDMQAILKSALRLRPDRIIVGDIRGSEAETLFTAMNTGHMGVMGTLHANNASDAITRLQNQPMNVPRGLLPLVDFIVVEQRFNDRKRGILRRVVQVSEVSKIEEDVLALNDLFLYDRASDSLERTRFQSLSFEKLAKATNATINDVKNASEERKQMIDELRAKGAHSNSDVNDFLLNYYKGYYRS